MPALRVEDLYRLKGEVSRSLALAPDNWQARVTVHMGTCGISSGADGILAVIREELNASGKKDILVTTSGCAGICNREPLITVERLGEEAVKYADLTPETARRIFREHVVGGRVLPELAFVRGWEQPELKFEGTVSPEMAKIKPVFEMPFFGLQDLRVMRNRGLINADSIDEYIARDGYMGAAKALFQMTPKEVIQEIKASGLRGRGGAGFPTGIKWDFAAASKSDVKYMLCNADEGDPGAFMDRCVLESDPHAVIEGMIIGARAIGAHEGYIYCRAEYPLAVRTLNRAIDQANEYGLLGDDILGTGFCFHLEVYRGAGAFVCGEETALMTSIEGKRGTPRPRPPFSRRGGVVEKAHGAEQRGNPGQHRPDHPEGGPAICRRGGPAKPGHQGFRHYRGSGEHRPGGGAHGHSLGPHHLRHRRRDSQGKEIQGRPAGRALRGAAFRPCT